MIYPSSSAQHSICNNFWSHSNLNLCNEGENISFAITCIPGFHAPLPFRSWTVQSFALFCVFHSLACQTIFGMSTGEEHPMFLAHCKIQLCSGLVIEETYEAADCLVQSHLRAPTMEHPFHVFFYYSLIFSLATY